MLQNSLVLVRGKEYSAINMYQTDQNNHSTLTSGCLGTGSIGEMFSGCDSMLFAIQNSLCCGKHDTSNVYEMVEVYDLTLYDQVDLTTDQIIHCDDELYSYPIEDIRQYQNQSQTQQNNIAHSGRVVETRNGISTIIFDDEQTLQSNFSFDEGDFV